MKADGMGVRGLYLTVATCDIRAEAVTADVVGTLGCRAVFFVGCTSSNRIALSSVNVTRRVPPTVEVNSIVVSLPAADSALAADADAPTIGLADAATNEDARSVPGARTVVSVVSVRTVQKYQLLHE